MKTVYLLAFALFAFGTASFATEDQSHVTSPRPEGDRLSLEDIMNEIDTTADLRDHWHGIWHCTAYPEGHGHTYGYSYYDVHYEHAYWGAVERCERATYHHCHDVNCHQDHR